MNNESVLYCTRPYPHVCAVNGAMQRLACYCRYPVRIFTHLPPGTIALFNAGTPRAYIETDSARTVLAALNEANLRRADFEAAIVSEYGKDFSQPWGIVERYVLDGATQDGYLDLYTQHRWDGWKMAQAGIPNEPVMYLAGRAGTIAFNKFLEARKVPKHGQR
jgi:hypothetical protein